MSKSKPYKWKKRGAGRFVQLSERLQATAAWSDLKPGPRALYIEIRRRYDGKNNGRILLSHRDAAEALNVHRNTVGAYFDSLIDHGFICQTQAPYLGPDGVGRSALLRITEEACNGKAATRDFDTWRPKTKAPHKNCA